MITKDKLLQYAEKHKTIELDTLIKLYGDSTAEAVSLLSNEGMLSAVKSSGTDGNLFHPLYKKYRICTIKEDYTQQLSEIAKLHPKLISNGFLRNKPAQYEKEKSFVNQLNKYLCNTYDTALMSRRERSLIIFGDEKVLDEHLSFLSTLGLDEDNLKYYVTPEQCFSDYIPKRSDSMTLLICENKDIWYNIRRLMFENNKTELFGTHLDGAIYGQGNDITGKGKFNSYAKYLCGNELSFLYCGDIDKAGFDIFVRLRQEAEYDIRLFVPIYAKMLELCSIDMLPDSEDGRNITVDISEILPLFNNAKANKLNAVLELNKRLPQEIINYQVLCENMR